METIAAAPTNEMEIFGIVAFLSANCLPSSPVLCLAHFSQRAKRATPFEMTKFHTDEYVDFLQRVAPDTADDLTGKGTRCEQRPEIMLLAFCYIQSGGTAADS